MVQLDFTPEIEVFNMHFVRCQSKDKKNSNKQHTNYINFLSNIQLDHPVVRVGRAAGEDVQDGAEDVVEEFLFDLFEHGRGGGSDDDGH